MRVSNADIEVTEKDLQYRLILHNDDMNEYQYVVLCLMDACRYGFVQAEQCVLLTQSKGKYAIKTGSFKQLFAIKETLSSQGLIVEIE